MTWLSPEEYEKRMAEKNAERLQKMKKNPVFKLLLLPTVAILLIFSVPFYLVGYVSRGIAECVKMGWNKEKIL